MIQVPLCSYQLLKWNIGQVLLNFLASLANTVYCNQLLFWADSFTVKFSCWYKVDLLQLIVCWTLGDLVFESIFSGQITESSYRLCWWNVERNQIIPLKNLGLKSHCADMCGICSNLITSCTNCEKTGMKHKRKIWKRTCFNTELHIYLQLICLSVQREKPLTLTTKLTCRQTSEPSCRTRQKIH